MNRTFPAKMSATARPDAPTVQQVRHTLDELTARIERLCQSSLPPAKFFPPLLRLLRKALHADATAVWSYDETGQLQAAYHDRLPEPLRSRGSAAALRHLPLIQQALLSGEPVMFNPPAEEQADAAQEGLGEVPWRRLLVPLVCDGQIVAALEVLQPPDAVVTAQRACMRYLVTIGESVQQWWERQPAPAEAKPAADESLDRYRRLAHASLDARQAAMILANEARRTLGCDRVSVALCRGGSTRIEAISGQAEFDRRSNVVSQLTRLVARVVAVGEPLLYDGTPLELPPQLETALADYVELSHAQTIMILPLVAPPRPTDGPEDEREKLPEESPRVAIGAMIVEQIGGRLPARRLLPRLRQLAEIGQLALANAVEHSGLLLLPVWRWLGRRRRWFQGRALPRTVLLLLLVVGSLAAAGWAPAELKLPAAGTLQPVREQHVYAEVAGVIRHVHVASGQEVKRGQLLMELANPQLEANYQHLQGERDTTTQELRSIRFRRLRGRRLSAADRLEMAGEQDRLETRLASLQAELALLSAERDALRIYSPISGRIATWEVTDRLTDRPVTVGQQLLSVYEPAAGWQLELNMLDRRMGHVTAAADRLAPGERLPVTFVLASDPAQTRRAAVTHVQPIAELHAEQGHSVALHAQVERETADSQPALVRPGTMVLADVHCGQASLGYVWLYEAVAAAQRCWFWLF